MGITQWLAVAMIFVVIYGLIKRYETRLVLIGSGLVLCLLSWDLIGGLNAFAKSMTNSSLVMAICASGFAFVARYTNADRSLVHYLASPIRGLGVLLVPVCTAITFFVNIAIPSAAGCAAAVGSTLIPVMLRAGIKPARCRCRRSRRHDRFVPFTGHVTQPVRCQHGRHRRDGLHRVPCPVLAHHRCLRRCRYAPLLHPLRRPQG